MLYAYGAMEGFNGLYDIDRVRLHIDQPRVDNFSSWEISGGSIRLGRTGSKTPR